MKPNIPPPTKEQVRHWLANQVKDHKPIPSQEQLRRELGWNLKEKAH